MTNIPDPTDAEGLAKRVEEWKRGVRCGSTSTKQLMDALVRALRTPPATAALETLDGIANATAKDWKKHGSIEHRDEFLESFHWWAQSRARHTAAQLRAANPPINSESSTETVFYPCETCRGKGGWQSAQTGLTVKCHDCGGDGTLRDDRPEPATPAVREDEAISKWMDARDCVGTMEAMMDAGDDLAVRISALLADVARLTEELDEAYAEMHRQSPAVRAVFDRKVWERVARWGISKGLVDDAEHDENCGAIHFPNGKCTCGKIE